MCNIRTRPSTARLRWLSDKIIHYHVTTRWSELLDYVHPRTHSFGITCTQQELHSEISVSDALILQLATNGWMNICLMYLPRGH